MYEYGAIFTLVGSDGTTVIFNDGLSGLVLEDVTGFDSPNIRTNVEDLPESDEASAGDSFFGQRPVTLKGKIVGLSAADRNAAVVNLQRALRGLRADLTLKSQPSGLPAMQTKARGAGLRITGGFVKDFLASLICADPRIYSQALETSTGTQSSTPSAPGASFPWSFPINWGGGGGAYSAALNITNAGNYATPVVLRIGGPITSPQLTDATSGLSIYVDSVTLVSGEYIDVDTHARTVTKNDGTNLYSKVRFPGTTWFSLDPGSSTIQLWGTGTTGATALSATWRDAWL